MERVITLGGALASTISAARQMADGTEKLAEIFQRAGAQLQEVVPDCCTAGHGLSDEIRSVAELLLAWREVGEVGVMFASHMLAVSASMSDLVSKMELETQQRFAEARRLVQASSGEGQDEKIRNWFGRLVCRAAKSEESQQRQKERELVLTTCLDNVAEQLDYVRREGIKSISDAVVFARNESRIVGERISLLKAHWKGRTSSERAVPQALKQHDVLLISAHWQGGSSIEAAPPQSLERSNSQQISSMLAPSETTHEKEKALSRPMIDHDIIINTTPNTPHDSSQSESGAALANYSPVVNIDYWKLPLPSPVLSDEE